MNLATAFKEARLGDIPAWAEHVQIVHPYTGESISPREFQLTGLHDAIASDNQRFGLYDTMGAGKSLVSYLYIAYHHGLGNKTVVVMPPKLLRQYKNNFYAMLKGIPIWMEIYHGPPKVLKQLTEKFGRDPPHVLVTSPEFFRRDWLWFHALGYDVLVQDEAKWLSNPDTNVAQVTRLFLGPECSKAALLMNGTPARNDLVNLYGYIAITSPDAYNSPEHFKRRHMNYEKIRIKFQDKKGRERTREVRKIAGYKNQDEIYRNLYLHGRRVEMPPPTEVERLVHEVSLGDQHYERYRQLVEERLIIFDDNSLIDVTQASALRHTCMQAVMDPGILRVSGKSELVTTTREMIEEVDGKILLCAYYQRSVEVLLEEFADLGAVALYGKIAGNRAERAKQSFIRDPSCRVMVINYESGGVGLDGLQDVCQTMIAVEPTGVPGDDDQTVARLARPGQKNAVRVWSLLAEGTLYRKIITERLKKKAAIETVVRQAGKMTKAELRAELLGL